MKNIRKIIVGLIIAGSVFGLSACGKTNTQPKQLSTTQKLLIVKRDAKKDNWFAKGVKYSPKKEPHTFYLIPNAYGNKITHELTNKRTSSDEFGKAEKILDKQGHIIEKQTKELNQRNHTRKLLKIHLGS